MAGEESTSKLRGKLLRKALDKTVAHFKVPELVTDKDRDFIESMGEADSWESLDKAIDAHFSGTRLSESFFELLKKNVAGAWVEVEMTSSERAEKAKSEKEKVEARKVAKEKYGVAVPVMRVYFAGKEQRTALEELEAVQAEVGALEEKLAKADELRELAEKNKKAYADLRTGLLEGFLDTQAVVEEARKMTQKKLQELITEGGKDIEKGKTAGAENALKYLNQLQMMEETGGTDYFENGVEIEGTKFSAEQLKKIVQEAIEAEVAKKISEEVEKVVAKGKPDAILKVYTDLWEKTTVGEKTGEDAQKFVAEVVGEKFKEFVKKGEKVKALNMNLALKKANFLIKHLSVSVKK